MSKEKRKNPARDLLLAILLVILVKPALHLSAKRMRAQQENQESFPVHELDTQIVHAFQVAKEQIDQAIILATKKKKLEEIELLEDLSSTLTTIEKRYGHNSPALLFLGPFSSVSIVIKEREIEQKLNDIIDQVGKTLCKLAGWKEQTLDCTVSLAKRLTTNQQMLKKFQVS